ncbi:patatin-like phospholipase family protein [Rhodoferax sp. AJA081-3]|uniref:patatin-like phospholipase family protein n=1 Tax=Rhodoferax sp. AJA081-3 TaxID=2752316 RepID=UPI001AE0D8AE|nr:patatin-like phospholipase family protein [Rhodoferax sp. AJA081-3]QTN29042.1 patatin-like phospholipase family protein [Rhodoferax sp. AJA081-3]
MFRLLLASGLAVLFSGCASLVPPPEPTKPLDTVNPKYGYRFSNLQPGPDNSDGLFMVVAFSGGGTRSAALAYGVLDKLRDTPIRWNGLPRRLLDEIDVINSVSGGSYAAAYYGLYGDAFFDDFPDRFLNADFQTELWDRYISVTGMTQVMGWSTNDRVDLLSAILERRLFAKKTFADLLERQTRPLVVIHATDLNRGSDFQFTQDQFDPLCTDLSSLPLARAVAASSAVPILFGPVVLKNHGGRCGYKRPSWIQPTLRGPQDQGWALRAQRHATVVDSYMDSSPETGRPWIHLIDGGISDNLGLRGPLESSIARGGFAPLLKRLGVKGVRKVVFLVVSAEVLPESGIDQSGKAPSIRQMASRVLDTLMANISFETQTWLRSSFHYWRHEARELIDNPDSPYEGQPDFYLIETSLRDIADPAERKTMMAIPTTFKLDPEQVQSLQQAGRTLLDNAPEFKRLVQDLQ